MKAIIPRLIGYGIIVLMALVNLLTAFSTEALTVIGVLLVMLLIAVLVGKEKSVVSVAPALAFGWLLFGVVVPRVPVLQSYMLEEGISLTMNALTSSFEKPGAVLGLAAFIAAQLFLRKSDKLVAILLRYIACGWMMLTFHSHVEVNGLPVLIPLILNLSFELRSARAGWRKARTTSNLFCWLFGLLIYGMFGSDGIMAMVNCVIMDGCVSIFAIIGVGVLAGLMILEQHCENKADHLRAFVRLGSVLLYWCAMALIMLLMPSLANLSVLFVGTLVLYHCYNLFLRAWINFYTKTNVTLLFYVVWSLICVGILGLAKSINAGYLLVSICLAVGPLAAVACWLVSRKSHKEGQVMRYFLGIVSVILLAVSVQTQLDGMAQVTAMVLTVATLCLIWCMLSARIYKLEHTASTVDPREFQTLAKIHGFVPMLILVVALLKILFAKTPV